MLSAPLMERGFEGSSEKGLQGREESPEQLSIPMSCVFLPGHCPPPPPQPLPSPHPPLPEGFATLPQPGHKHRGTLRRKFFSKMKSFCLVPLLRNSELGGEGFMASITISS